LSRLTIAFGLALLLVELSAAIALYVTSDHRVDPTQTVVIALTSIAMFALAGLVALWRRPTNRTGLFLAATGYLWFLGALTESNSSWLFTIGWIFGGAAFVPFAALVLVHPTGRFENRLDRAVPVVVATVLIVPSFIEALVDPTPASSYCDDCPESAIALADLPTLAGAVEAIELLLGLALILFAVALLVRRWRRATPALRRALLPVLVTGAAALLSLFVINVIGLVSEGAGTALAPIFVASVGLVPVAFLVGILRSRLARSSVTDVVVALQNGVPLREAMADALGDPSLAISYRLTGSARWVDAEGRSVPEPSPVPGRAQRTIERVGMPIAVLEYDAHLADEHELVDAVSAAAGLALHNERLQAELRAEVNLAGTFSETAPSLLVNVDTDGRIVRLNVAALKASGYSDEDDVRGRYFWDVMIDKSEREQVIARFAEAAPDFPPSEYENTFTNARGEELVVYWRSAPVLDEDGRTVSIVAAGLDISERHRLEAEKEREREFLNAIANNAPSLLCLIDDEGRVADRGTNIAFEKALEYDPADTGGHVFWERYVDPAEADEVGRLFERVKAGETVSEHDNLWVAKSGRRLLIAWTCTPLPQLDERRLFLLSGVDVTERKEREQAAERQRDFLHAITEAVPSFLVTVDPNATVVEESNNRAFLETFGWTEDQVVGKSFLGLIAREDDHAARMTIANAANGVPQAERESRWLDRNGDERIVAWSARPVLDPGGRSLVLVSGSDVTVRRRQEEEIRASRARIVQAEADARRQLERNLHDGAQQRLVALSVALRLAESKLAQDPDGAAALLDGAREELALALEELRELARGIHPAVLTDRGLGPALEALVGRAPIPVELSAPEERLPPAVEAAAYYVVAEALTNVAKYGQANSARVSVAAANGTVTVTVSDDGVGGADPASGSGLRGLADRVEALEGRLDVMSPRGLGTTVSAEIPLPGRSDP
jgi:PAS domain S-box-containing protein